MKFKRFYSKIVSLLGTVLLESQSAQPKQLISVLWDIFIKMRLSKWKYLLKASRCTPHRL
jgi:hypothetical protein